MFRSRSKRSQGGVAADSLESAVPDPVAERVALLERAFERLSGSGSAALRVMELIDDPSSSAGQVAAAIDADPVFTAQLLRVANSAGLGLSSTIATTARAVSVVGFTTIRALAAVYAAGVSGSSRTLPDGFREHSAAAAAGCVAVSTRFGVQRDEAFSMGILHDLGWALLDSIDPNTHRDLVDGSLDSVDQCAREVARFGVSHPHAAARVLESWKFPDSLVAEIRDHHDPFVPDGETSPHRHVLLAGDALAHEVLGRVGFAFGPADLVDLGFSIAAVDDLLALTEEYTLDILASLGT